MHSSRSARLASPAWFAARPRWAAVALLALALGLLPASLPAQTLAAGTTITVTTFVDEMSDNGLCSLREAVDSAGSNQALDACPAGGVGQDVIMLSAGTYTLSLANLDGNEDFNLTGDLDVVASMRIEGAGAAQTIIDGGGIDRIFDINEYARPISEVAIRGVTLRNGVIPVPGWSADILTNPVWPSLYSGGAIRNGGHLVVENSVISANHAQIYGGAIISVYSLQLINTQVTGNLVRLDVTDPLLLAAINQVAARRGGAIVSQDLLSITGSAVDDNVGGGIFNVVGTATVSASTVSRNQTSAGNGAGISNLGGTLALSGSQVLGNLSLGGGAGIVGVSTSGSGYVYSSAITISDSRVSGNQAGGSGGGILLLEGDNPGGVATNAITITRSLVSGNQAGIDGGGIAVSPAAATLLLEASTLSGNSVLASSTSFGYGGIANNGVATIRDSTISGNSALATSGHGGGIGNNGSLTLSGGAVIQNQATYAGGIYNTPSGTISATGVIIQGNTAQFTGGGVRNDGALTISGGIISANSATGAPAHVTDDDMARGGGIFNLGTLTVRDGTQITGNTAYLGGGLANTTCRVIDPNLGTVNLPGQASLANSTLSGNVATLWGGGITNEGGLSLTGATLSGNQTFSTRNLTGVDINGQPITILASEAGLGGAMVNGIEKRFFGRGMSQWCVATNPAPTVSATIVSSTISQNVAGQAAGGVANYATLTINDTAVLGNSAHNFAGGLHNAGTLTISAARVAENSAETGFAGGIHNDGMLNISASTVISNTAGSDGGGIVNGDTGADLPEYLRLPVSDPPAQLQMSTTTVQANQAAASGGGIFNLQAGSRVTVVASTLAGNQAGLSGGGIDSNATLGLTNVTLSGNSAGLQGGGLNVRASGVVSADFVTITANQLVSPAVSGAQIASQGQTRLRGSILFHTGAGAACGGALSSLGYNLLPVGCVAAAATGDQVGNNPLLGALAANGGPTRTHALLRASPALDTGGSAGCPATDQRGIARPADGNGDGSFACDSGAYEARFPEDAPPFTVYLPLIKR